MPGNKKNKRVIAKSKPTFLARIAITMAEDGSVECLHYSKDDRMTFAAFEAALMAATREKAFDKYISPATQARRMKRAMLRYRSWFYRYIVSLFI